MAKRMTDEEIRQFINSKSVTQDNYVAPTVRSNTVSAPAMSVVASKPVQTTVKPTVKQAIKQYGDTIKNSAVKNQGFTLSNAITDLANLYDARRNIATSIPGIGKAYDVGTKTLGNIATNMGIGATKSIEGAADTLSDLYFNPRERAVNYIQDFIAKGKKTADENLKDLKEQQKRDIQKNMTEEFTRGYNEVLPEWEKNSLVRQDNFGGQVAQGVGGMVPSLILGGAYGSNPQLTSLKGLSGREKLMAALGNVRNTYLSQLPSNAMLGASSYGSGLEEALEKGAPMWKSRLSGLSNAAIETGTEMLTGGVPGLEGKGGIDQFFDPLLSKVGGYGGDLLRGAYRAGGEGLEELVGTYLDALAKKGILGEDINWKDVNREALQSGLIGAATGALLDAPQLVNEIQSTREEKAANKPKTQTQLNTTSNTQQTNVQETASEPTQMAQEAQNVEERPINQENRIESQEANETRYSMPSESKIQNFRDSVQREGIKDADGFYKAVEKIIQDKDYNVIMDSSIKNADGKPVNALISNDNGITIKINPNSERAGEILLMHEVTHGIETKEMSDLIIDYASKNPEFNSALEDLKSTYGTQEVTPEVVADISGQLFGNQEFINNLSTQKPSIFRRIYDAIVSMANKLTGNSKEALFIRDLKNKWESAYRNSTIESSQKTLKEATRYSLNSELEEMQNKLSGNVKTDRTTNNEGEKLSRGQQNFFKDASPEVRDKNGGLKKVYHTVNHPIVQFNEFNPVGTPGYRFGDQVVIYTTPSKEMSGSYANQEYEMADTQRLNSVEEAENWLFEEGLPYYSIKNNTVFDDEGAPILQYKNENELLRNIKSDIAAEEGYASNLQYEGYVNIKNPFVVESSGSEWDSVSERYDEERAKLYDDAVKTKKQAIKDLVSESREKQKTEYEDKKIRRQIELNSDILNSFKDDRLNNIFEKLKTGSDITELHPLLRDAKNYKDFVERAKKYNIELPSANTKLFDLIKRDAFDYYLDNENIKVDMSKATIEDFVNNLIKLYETEGVYGAPDRYFYFNMDKVFGESPVEEIISPSEWIDAVDGDFSDEVRETLQKKPMTTNDVVKYVIAENLQRADNEKYDGVIFKKIYDYGGEAVDETPEDVYAIFNSNQFKAADNLNPTDDPDIRYSQDASKWQDFLEKNFKSRGTTTNLNEKVSKGPALAETKNVKKETNKVVKESFKTKEKTTVKKEVKTKPVEEKNVDNKITSETLKRMSKDLTKELNESFKLKKNEAYSRTPQTVVKSMSVYENAPSITDFDRKTVVHTIMSDEAAKIDAKARYEKNGSLEENAAYIRGLLQSDKRLTKNDKALAIYTVNEAYKQGNKAIGDGIVSDITVLDVEAGQWAQASKLMKQMSPFGQLQTFVKMINNSVEKGNPRFKNVKITEDQINKVLDCYDKDGNWDADQFAKNMEEFKFNIQEQMTPTLMDKFNSVRMLGMLGAPRTHIRNMLGNVGNMGLRTVKNFNDRVLESVLIGNNTEQRTRTFKPATKEVKDYVSNLTKEELFGGNKYSDTKTELERNMKVFNEHHKGMAKIVNPISKAMNMLSDGNSWALDYEDKLFSSVAYKRSLQEYLTAKGMETAEDIEANPQVLADGKEFAMQQALEATYRQDSELAAAISNYVKKAEKPNAKKTDKFLGLIVESNIPFKKTPINIAKTGIEFSPIGLTTGIYDTLVNVKNGKIEMSQAIDEISKGITGLGLLGIGALLAHSGFELHAADDDKDKKAKYDKSLGEMEYSIKIGNRYYDLSWMAPAAMPLYTGIELYQTLVNEKEFNGNAVINTLAKTIDPLSSMSLLEGLSKSVQSYSKTPGEFISKFTLSSLENYITQYIPTLLSQIANLTDDKKRYTGASGDSDFTEFEKTWNSIKIKVPGLRQTLPEQTDAWGRTQMNDPVGFRIFNSFFNPANNSLDKKDDTDRELERLYNDLGEDNYYATRSLPKMSFDKYLTIDKQRVNLSNEELVKYKKTYGKTAKEGADKLIKTSEYKNATDEEKGQMLAALYDYANQKAKEEYGKEHNLDYDDYKLDQLYSLVDAYNIPIEKVVSNKSIQQLKADGNMTAKQKKISAVDDIDGLTKMQKDALKRKFTMFMGNPGYKEGEYALVAVLNDSNVSEETKEDIRRFLSLE